MDAGTVMRRIVPAAAVVCCGLMDTSVGEARVGTRYARDAVSGSLRRARGRGHHIRRTPGVSTHPLACARVTANHDSSKGRGAASGPVAYADAGSGNYAILMSLLCAVVILSGIGAAKGVVFGPIITDGGFFLFPLAYVLGDVISEIFGLKAARRAIYMSFGVNILAVLCYSVIIALPGFDDDYGIEKQAALEGALGPVWQVVLAGVVGYVVGQSINSMIMTRMKKRDREKRLITRMAGATGAGELADTILFCTIAATAIGIDSIGQWANYTAFGYLYKMIVQYAALPVTAAVVKRIKRNEPTYQAALAEAEAARG